MDPQVNPQEKSGWGKGCMAGCGCGCLVILLLAVAAVYAGWKITYRQLDTFLTGLERQGYRRVEGQTIVVTNRVTEPTVYVGQVVRVLNGSDRGLGFMCQSAEIDGQVAGNVYFLGQTLTVDKGAELMRDLDAKAQTVNLFGTIHGKVVGMYMVLNQPNGTNGPPAAAP